ncbi:dUTP diphosphatase [Methylibium petroleiphilum]|uniref:dUTP diphosphatase n=1 Tax=Methylibium petroleiphilum (strain ATCC BAA-1232 / LMG 22953 / PM1) TaxID=420662 RepID=A2SNC0_METPP|nr:dUTP diphosphatase [Methylibium petroleiphilum]ABM97059.1 deoxyuridine 5'-triphosphate nucleotidohydrolase [Methylibium petroleiphilum PM1]
MTLLIKIKRTRPDARVPEYATSGAACFDLHACIDDGPPSIVPGASVAFDTGLAFEIPEGYVLQVFSRSGHGFKHGVRLANTTGIIDSDYRDSVKVKLHNDGKEPFEVKAGDRIAQAMVIPVPRCSFEEVDQLTDTARGLGGFGSTGA